MNIQLTATSLNRCHGSGTINPSSAQGRAVFTQMIQDQIARQPFFKGLNPQQIQILADSAMKVEFEPGQWIYRQGDIANRFYVILEGEVVLESDVMDRHVNPIRKIGPGEGLGWAWLFPPFYMHFSAQAIGAVKAIFFYGTRLRQQCEQNHDLGNELILRASEVVIRNLHATQQRVTQFRGHEKVEASSSEQNVLSSHVE